MVGRVCLARAGCRWRRTNVMCRTITPAPDITVALNISTVGQTAASCLCPARARLWRWWCPIAALSLGIRDTPVNVPSVASAVASAV